MEMSSTSSSASTRRQQQNREAQRKRRKYCTYVRTYPGLQMLGTYLVYRTLPTLPTGELNKML
jgi:hypothetical protein